MNNFRKQCAKELTVAMVSTIRTEADYIRIRNHADRDGLKVSEWIARDAVKQADALIAELSK